jgi:hypothetical protein
MRRHLEILAAIALTAFGLAVVRPRVPQLYEAAWEPVLQEAIHVEPESYEAFELAAGGEYLMFLEGPALDARWNQYDATPPNVDLFRGNTHLPTIQRGIGYEYVVGDRRGVAIAQLELDRGGDFELGEMAEGLDMPGWRLAMCLSGPVRAADRRGQAVLVAGGGVGLAILMVVVLLLLRRGLDAQTH